MKINILLLPILVIFFFLSISNFRVVNAQMMPSISFDLVNQTQKEELEGKKIFDNLNNQKVNCSQLNDNDFELLGDYFMGRSIGSPQNHTRMDEMMKIMIGEQGKEQMHIAMGKRLSGCDLNVPIPLDGNNFISMFYNQKGGGNPMMGYGGWGNMMGWGSGIFGWLLMLIFWILLILGVIALIRYLGGWTRSKDKEKSSLDILKDRYAKGEIDKKEFEEKKRDLA